MSFINRASERTESGAGAVENNSVLSEAVGSVSCMKLSDFEWGRKSEAKEIRMRF